MKKSGFSSRVKPPNPITHRKIARCSSQHAPPAPLHWPTTRRDALDVRRGTATKLASMTTGAAATSRCARKYTAAATRNNTSPKKNTRRPSRSRSRNARTTRRARNARRNYAGGLYGDDGATLDELRESVTTFEEIERIAHRALGSAHPLTKAFGGREGD